MLERQIRDVEVVDINSFPRARALMDEAKGIGLIDEGVASDPSSSNAG